MSKKKHTNNNTKTLGHLVKYWIDARVSVELKGGGPPLRGILVGANADLSVTLETTTTTTTSTVFVRGSKIRNIVFDDHPNLQGLVKVGRERERQAVQKYQRGIRKTT